MEKPAWTTEFIRHGTVHGRQVKVWGRQPWWVRWSPLRWIVKGIESAQEGDITYEGGGLLQLKNGEWEHSGIR